MNPRLQLPEDDEGTVVHVVDEGVAPPSTVDVARERLEGRIAGGAGILSVLLTLVAVPVGARDLPDRVGSESNDRTLLLDIGASGAGQETAMWLRVTSILLIAPVAVFLYRAVRGRQPSHASWIPAMGTVALVVVAAGTVIGFFEVREIAREFVSTEPRTLDRAESLLDEGREGGLLQAANIGQVVGGLLLGVWVSLTSLEAMRVGLLTRFLGVFGMGTGLASAIGIPISAALFLGWFGSVSILAFGYWPGGRPGAWDAGRAIGWDEAEAQEGGGRLRRGRAL